MDDHPALLEGLVSIFALDPRYVVANTGSSAGDAEAIAHWGQCDVLIVDLSMPGDVLAVLGRIAANSPGVKLIVFTAYERVDLAIRALDIGVGAFVLKGSPTEELHAAIAAVVHDEVFVSPSFSSRVVAGLRQERTQKRLPRLSTRERQLVECLLRGKSNKEIATDLGLTEKTVKHYMTNLMVKLQVHSRLEVVVAAQRWAKGDGELVDASLSRPSP